MGRILLLAACCALSAFGQDAREIVRRSIELDQVNWLRMADYTWVVRSHERHFDTHGAVSSEHREAWESLVLDGRPFRRMLEREGKPLPVEEQAKEDRRFDKATARLEDESAAEKQRHAADYQKMRRRERAFLLEIPEAFDMKLEGTEVIDGHEAWVISGTPRPGYRPKSRESAALLKVLGKIWIEKEGYQWVRLEAQTTGTISYGLFLARLNPGARLVFEQERINNEVWLPKRFYVRGSGRLGLVKRLAEDEEITWNDYRKFHVESVLKAGVP